MKTLLQLLLVACLGVAFTPSATSAPPAEQNIYMIHIGAFVKTQISDFNNIRPLGFIYVKQFDDRLLRVYMGDYSTEAAANEALAAVKAKGYPDAYVTRRNLSEGKEVAVIQIGLAQVGERIEWNDYAKAGPIMVQPIDGRQLKIVVGTYPSVDYAKGRIGSIRKAGFSDAFVRPVNSALLHRITTFEAAGLLDNAAGLASERATKPNVGTGRNSDEIPVRSTKKEENSPAPDDSAIPDSYDDQLTVKSPQAQQIALPVIRKNVKRNSVIELQRILKDSKAYRGSLDGLYGPGTGQGYETAVRGNREIQKYLILNRYTDEMTSKGNENILQHYINTLIEDTPTALRGLETTDSPTANAYRAYILFRQQGSQTEIDNLMNSAIKDAFNSPKTKQRPPFDYRAAYTYKDIGQLILHLRFIQTAYGNDIAFPCWLFQLHPKESTVAFSSGTRSDYRIQDCGSMMDWEELQLLEIAAEELNPTGAVNGRDVAQYASKRAELLLLPRTPDFTQQKEAEEWHQSLMTGLDAWEKTDPLHSKLLYPLRVSYYQSMVRLEDYYMDKGMKPKAARGLAICMLQTIVGPHLQTYLK
ncbi:MAG: SPOR domain-containing protein [Bacteroidota bacterium]